MEKRKKIKQNFQIRFHYVTIHPMHRFYLDLEYHEDCLCAGVTLPQLCRTDC